MRASLILLFAVLSLPASAETSSGTLDFSRDIRPILAENCFSCHGFDDAKRKAGLRLDTAEGAYKLGSGGLAAITPRKPERSGLIQRITTNGPLIMPPANSGKHLTPKQIKILQTWVAQGGVYKKHWAYVKPIRPSIPKIHAKSWPRNGLDYFVLSNLESHGLKPSPPADRYTLIRRASLDLTGLPPTVDEADSFVHDKSVNAYEKVVDRLLASPHYGERMARVWLDLARYADTNGYEKDLKRSMWPWRDWLIEAFNNNMPFDQFTIEMLAGDLLPKATISQKIASGFNRNTMLNDEGGSDPEEFRVVAVLDRVDATATAFLGTTLACAQCHTHKYDPFTQKEYYQFLSFFNQSQDTGVNPQPILQLPTPTQQKQLDKFSQDRAAAEKAGDKKQVVLLKSQKEQLDAAIPTTLIMHDIEEPRPNRLLIRGDFRTPGDEVQPDVPSIFPPLPHDAPHNRLGLAQWLVNKNHPLTARVTVNRFWEQIFGRGIVNTLEDFGSQSDAPSNEELLDWLAVEFMWPSGDISAPVRGWDIKRFMKMLVMSATYCQSSEVMPQLIQTDPNNILLARGPRFRVEAEMVRDIALYAGERLTPTIGGPSVMPPQPSGIWENSFSFYDTKDRWKDETGPNRYRRGIYTFWRRTASFPTALTFDTNSRDVCSAKRGRTNTPLQALNTLNDPIFVEAAGGLAIRMMQHTHAEMGRANYGFRCAVTRPPSKIDIQKLISLYHNAKKRFDDKPALANSLLKQCGIHPYENKITDTAAWVVVANVILNMDETVTKG